MTRLLKKRFYAAILLAAVLAASFPAFADGYRFKNKEPRPEYAGEDARIIKVTEPGKTFVWPITSIVGAQSGAASSASVASTPLIVPVYGEWKTGSYDSFGVIMPASLDGMDPALTAGDALTQAGVGYQYAISIFSTYEFQNFQAKTWFYSASGDYQAVGIVFGFHDDNNFYIARAGSSDNKFTLYHYYNDKKWLIAKAPAKTMISDEYSKDEVRAFAGRWNEAAKSAPTADQAPAGVWRGDVTVTSGAWHELKVRRRDGVIEMWFDGHPLARYFDLSLRWGKVGFFSKYDTRAYFAGMQVTTL